METCLFGKTIMCEGESGSRMTQAKLSSFSKMTLSCSFVGMGQSSQEGIVRILG